MYFAYAAGPVCADVRDLRTHGPGLGSHDCEWSQGQNHVALKQLSHHFLSQRAAPASLSALSCIVPLFLSNTHIHSLSPPSRRCQEALTEQFPTAATLFSLLIPPLLRPTEDNMRPSVWSH